MHPALSIYYVFNVILKHSMLLLKYRSEIELVNGGHFMRSRRDSNFPAYITPMPENNKRNCGRKWTNGRNGVEVYKCVLNPEW